MNTKIKAVLFFLVTVLCIYGIRMSLIEVQQEDFFVWGESSNPPREWLILFGGLGFIVLPAAFGWMIAHLLRMAIARDYGLD